MCLELVVFDLLSFRFFRGPANSEYREKERKEAKLRKWKARRGYFGGNQETVKVEEVGLTVKTVGDSKSYK